VRYARYLRCSTDEQADRDYSTTDVQDALTLKYVRERGGINAGLYVDDGYSGTTLKRPGLKRLLAEAEEGKFDVVVVTYLSRLGRGEAGTAAEWNLREEHGVTVEYIKENFTDDAQGRLNKAATRFMDGMYVENIRSLTMTKMEQMMMDGYVVGHVPFGYGTESAMPNARLSRSGKEPPKRPVLHPEHALIVRHAFALFAERGSIASVRDYLTAVTGKRWTTTSAGHLLRNEAYTGVLLFRDGKWRREDFFPVIIEREEWEPIQETLEGKRAVYAPKSDNYNYFLRGVLHCPHCGCVYSPAPAKGGAVPYYACLHDMKRKT
jgi:DNA invertase Pin-like site-specific DNA recombinase